MDIRVHATERFVERFAPQMAWDQARERIDQMITDADFVVRARERVNFWGDGYIVVTDGERVITVEKRQRSGKTRAQRPEIKSLGLEVGGREEPKQCKMRKEIGK